MEFVETINESELIDGTSKVISVKGKDIALLESIIRLLHWATVVCIKVVH